MATLDTIYDTYARIRQWIEEEVNFFRLHLIFFTVTPLIAACIFYGVNGEFHIPFIDALFLCYSALTVTGLNTVNVSTLTTFQQVILLLLMIMGNVTIIAWVMVLVRLRYFRQHILETHRKKTLVQSARDRVARIFTGLGSSIPMRHSEDGHAKHKKHGNHGVQASDGIAAALGGGAPIGLGLGIVLGASDENKAVAEGFFPSPHNQSTSHMHVEVESPTRASASFDLGPMHFDGEQDPEGGIITDAFTSSPRSGAMPLPVSPPSQHLQFAPDVPRGNGMVRRRTGVPLPRRRTVLAPKLEYTESGKPVIGQRPKDQGLGGFPGPFQLSRKIARKYFPNTYRKLTMMAPVEIPKTRKQIKWLPGTLKDLVIGRNGEFNTEELTDEQLEELGGIEYKALTLLSYLVISYFVGTQLISFIVFAPWFSTTHTYDEVFAAQPRLVNKTWYAFFQVLTAYTGTGLSLVDQGMVPFQHAYLMIFALMFVILAGNHGLPLFLRLIIWIYTKLVKDDGDMDQVLHFLLDHPRRCFLYLFPSHVTWYLVATLITFTAIEWTCFVVLNIGLEVTESLSPGMRALAGLFQSLAVRASGLQIVSVASLAPAFQFLSIVMMYIAVFPVALSIRSTNVYEEKSLGVYQEEPDDEDEEPDLPEGPQVTRRQRIGKYFGWHLRRQVAFDIWWLVWAIFIVCIVERGMIMDDQNAPWFNLFRIIFELVSAFGGIGLSLGVPYDNFAFSGSFKTLSKLVVIVIMVRGRHRGLPVAIDRAILLPEELVVNKSAQDQQGAPAQSQPVDGDVAVAQFVDVSEKGKNGNV
ncbi:TrkH-domain-containing protein [Fomes fomentarius]|nr:TrkH-domain-containing protein [Fomes fomentarius]